VHLVAEEAGGAKSLPSLYVLDKHEHDLTSLIIAAKVYKNQPKCGSTNVLPKLE
jgi:hypothetical protein